jgi:hypothetical protein
VGVCGDDADEPLLRHALQRGEQELAALERDIRTAQESSVRDSAEWAERRDAAAAAAAAAAPAGTAMAAVDDGDEVSLMYPVPTADDVHKWRSIERWAQLDSVQAAAEESGGGGGALEPFDDDDLRALNLKSPSLPTRSPPPKAVVAHAAKSSPAKSAATAASRAAHGASSPARRVVGRSVASSPAKRSSTAQSPSRVSAAANINVASSSPVKARPPPSPAKAARAGVAEAAPAAATAATSTADAAARAQHLKELQGLEMEMLRNRAHEAEQRCAAATTDAATFRAEAASLRDQLVHSQVMSETAASKATAEVRVSHSPNFRPYTQRVPSSQPAPLVSIPGCHMMSTSARHSNVRSVM